MVGISGGGGSGGGGYNYVQDAEPADPSEGEEWYDTGSNAAFVYDGAAWIEQTVVDHGQLSGVGASDHHEKTTDHGELSGITPAQHHSRPTGTNSSSDGNGFARYPYSVYGGGSSTYTPMCYFGDAELYVDDNGEGSSGYFEFHYPGGQSEAFSPGGANGGATTTVSINRFVWKVQINGPGQVDTRSKLGPEPLFVPPHSHSI